MSTIFISHSSADNALASELLDWLKARGYRSVFLDLDPDEGIEAGERWEKVLYRELLSCSVVLALVTESWLASKWCFAEATHARAGGKTILGLKASRGVQPSILADTQSIDYSPDNRTEAYQRLAEALRRAIDPQGLGRWDPARPLFPGLLYFDERDAPIFFGRRRLGRAIYQKLRELQAKPPGSERLLLVFGPSGSGKSSLMRAGTLPHVHANPDAWISLGPFRPGEGWPEPLRRTMTVLAGPDEPAALAELHEIAERLRGEAEAPKAAILLIVDQLEEALDAKDGAENAFWLPLSRLLAPRDTPFMAIATLRSDFMGDFQKRSARSSLPFGSVPIDPMSPEDLREVIAGPCRVAGIPIEAGLVDALVEDAGDEQALPLLALALNRLWLRHEDNQGGFTVADYRDGLGGMRGLIDREAESTLAGKGLREASVLDAFLSLTRLVREGVLARQPAAWDTLEPEAQKSLEPFVGARLLVRYGVEDARGSEPTAKETVVVDLVHETLLSGWKRLHDWLAKPENRDFLPWREELRHKVGRWTQTGEPAALLLDGAELKEARKWLNAKRLALSTQEAAYIRAGIDAHKVSKLKLAIAAAVLAGAAAGWWAWIRSDAYQIARIRETVPELAKLSSASALYASTLPSSLQDNLSRLAAGPYLELTLLAASEIKNPVHQADLFLQIARSQAELGQRQGAARAAREALKATGKIENPENAARMISASIEFLPCEDDTKEALDHLKRIGGEYIWAKDRGLANLAACLAYEGKTQEAMAINENIEDPFIRNEVFAPLAVAYAKTGDSGNAVATLKRFAPRYQGDVVEKISDLEKQLVRDGQTEAADVLAENSEFEDLGVRESVIYHQTIDLIIRSLGSIGRFDEGIRLSEKLQSPASRATALLDLTKLVADTGNKARAQELISHAIKLANEASASELESSEKPSGDDTVDIANAYRAAMVNATMAKAFASAAATAEATRFAGQALSLVESPGFRGGRKRTLLDLSKTLIAAGLVEQAKTACKLYWAEITAEKSESPENTLENFGSFTACAKAGMGDEISEARRLAVDAANSLTDPERKADALINLARIIDELGSRREALELFAQAFDTAKSILDERTTSRKYAEIAYNYAQLQQFYLARKTADMAVFSEHRLFAYATILKHFAITQNPALAAEFEILEYSH